MRSMMERLKLTVNAEKTHLCRLPKETFDFLYDEGRRGSPKWVDVLLHCDMGARPALMSVFERTLQYAKGHERVWFARRRDIARWVLEQSGAEVVSHDKMRRSRV